MGSVHRLSHYYLPTRREDPQEADIPSHRLMVRAGMVRRLSRGVYSFLPLGHRVLRKVEAIVREEMNRAGAQEVLLPILQPRELWERTGRWAEYGPEMMRLEDRHEVQHGLGPTHEEVVTDLVADELVSYRQCPVTLYQIATKFRDEIRPRFGVMRSREFVMKDAYSFDCTEEDARASYRNMQEAYRRIFDRIGFDYRQVEAATGAIGGSQSHEFMVPAGTGEDTLVHCESCGYAANREKAESRPPSAKDPEGAGEPESFPTPGVETIEDLVDVDPEATPSRQIKTLAYRVDKTPVAVLLPGDDTLNETRLRELGEAVEPLEEEAIRRHFGAGPGSLGAVDLDADSVAVWADPALRGRRSMFTGANRDGHHLRGVDVQRDIEVDRWVPLRMVKDGDPCPECEEPLEQQRGIEVGHVFYLGTKYSRELGAAVQDPNGGETPLIMGCYGIGISRIVAAAIEQSHDEKGIVWPPSIAPFDVYVLVINPEDDVRRETGTRLADELAEAGYEVLIDDRSESAGVKFNDSELIGIPCRVTVGRDVTEGAVEFTRRGTGEDETVELDGVVDRVREAIGNGG